MKDKRWKPRFAVGDEVYDPQYGFGKIEQVDKNNAAFPYYGVFNGGKKGVTKVWWRAIQTVPADKAPKKVKEEQA